MQKVIRSIICGIIALIAVSCVKEDDSSINYTPVPIPEMISARIPANKSKTKSLQGSGFIEDATESWDGAAGATTRTYAVVDESSIDPDTGEAKEYYQYWSEDDAISLFLTRANLKYVMQCYNLDIGEFYLQGDKTEGAALSTGYCYSVYPYKESTSISAKGKVTYEFPKTQHYSGDTYSNGENGMIARATMVGKDTVLYFQNFCSYLQLRLVAIEGQPSRVKQIILTSNSSTILLSGPGQIEVSDAAGEPKVTMDREPDVDMKRQGSNQIILDCGSGVELSRDENNPTKFWFVIPGDISFEGGFSVSVIYEDYSYYRKSTQKTIGIERSHIKPMATFKPVAIQAKRPIRYKYNDPGTAEAFPLKNTFYGEGGVALDILGQVYDEETGEWVVMLSGDLKTIGDNSFMGPGGDLEYIKVDNEDETITISDFAFYNCTADYLEVHNSVDQIRPNAFKASTITDVYIDGNVNLISSGVSSDSKIENINISGNVGTIEEKAFHACESLAGVSVGGNVDVIEQEAFESCHNLEIVEIGGDIDIIEAKAFNDNDKLHTIDITGDLEKIGQQAFYDCDALETFHIKGGIEEIGQEAFVGCDILNFVSIEGDVGSIGNRAFYDSDEMTFVDIHGNVGMIGEDAFASCDALQSFTVSGVDSIGVGAFLGCTSLTAVNIPGVKYIDKRAFENCYGIKTINLDSVITIDDSAFWACTSLTSVSISENCTMIGEGAFCNASSLVEVNIYAVEPPFIKTDNFDSSYAFAGTHPDLVIYIPAGSIDDYIDDEWFEGQTFDDPAIEAEVNWWYEEYEDYLVEM